ncbi:bis(5'-nucleosyl)-tetraphosphatase (symmetrical) YqeK [Bacillus carboniphilus]|uniref:bis(5'-nucleosyl)-tetraphosphatase (symmetrical) n=1 Tax=Bacillus carboniphilus TaxID=86663 RepID=A0ABY9JZM1_9BACI|nr:bis(5'-nucleosyl)-tetraphosphatase (symmetrical) YqeK [Bacillus carboniphilus]WLR44012.1 bis(5'-nucleosyl)-tetraphosphatase (symmetrical) YqeK [Bacillus carboniphilus]
MNKREALQIVKKQLPEARYLHTYRVMETAIILARRFNVNEKKAELAAIFHDYAKNHSKDEMKKHIVDQNMSPLLLQFHPELWHAPVGAFLVEQQFDIKDPNILNAIRFHTTGRMNMTKLEKVIFLADYIEPGRKFPGVKEVRAKAEVDLDKALFQSLKNTIAFLLEKNQTIFPDTFKAYNGLLGIKGVDRVDE